MEILELGGHSPFRVDNIIFMGNGANRIGSLCTYIPLVLVGLPLVWRGDRLIRDVLRIIFFVVIVSVVNAIRLYLTIVWIAKGIPCKYAHDLVNHLTYGPIVVLIVFLWLRAMKLRLTRKPEVVHSEKQH